MGVRPTQGRVRGDYPQMTAAQVKLALVRPDASHSTGSQGAGPPVVRRLFRILARRSCHARVPDPTISTALGSDFVLEQPHGPHVQVLIIYHTADHLHRDTALAKSAADE